MKAAAAGKLAVQPLTGTWFRAIPPDKWRWSLSSAHTRDVVSRFSPGASARRRFEILYLCENPTVALFEVGAQAELRGMIVPNVKTSHLIVNAEVRLQAIVDLCDPAAQRLLGTSAQELTGDWHGYQTRSSRSSISEPTGQAPTQLLGEALFKTSGVEGFRTYSAKMPQHANLVVFPTKLHPASQLVYFNPISNQSHVVKSMR
ncbi:MAG TPA: RES domain-containing protein [Pirellulales bacterium]|nr:RES domain-containing protein [Pirellulales bacterium]